MRRKLLVMLAVVLTLAVGVLILIAGTLTLPTLRENTWCVLPVIIISGLGIGHAILLFYTPSTSSKKTRQKQSAKVVVAGPTPVVAAAPDRTFAPAETEEVAHKTIFETMVGCCSPSRRERAWYTKMRSNYFSCKAFAACLGLVVVADILLPLLITGETSFGEAEVFQFSRIYSFFFVCSLAIHFRAQLYFFSSAYMFCPEAVIRVFSFDIYPSCLPCVLLNVQAMCYNRHYSKIFLRFNDVEKAEAYIDGDNFQSLLPSHIFNSLVNVTSFVTFCVWLFASPHRHTEEAASLDKKCMTFAMLRPSLY